MNLKFLTALVCNVTSVSVSVVPNSYDRNIDFSAVMEWETIADVVAYIENYIVICKSSLIPTGQ